MTRANLIKTVKLGCMANALRTVETLNPVASAS